MDMLKDKVVLVTGAGTGIGAAVARAAVQEGGKVVMVGRRAAALNAVARQIDHNDAVLSIAGDAGSIAEMRLAHALAASTP
jgi:NADP-dependent 3-hydroxy acid dehydrogenase YdfG